MSPEDNRLALIAAELRRDWQAVRTHLERARSIDPADSQPAASHVALSLDHAYQAFESLLDKLERALGLAPREGAGWHVALLEEAGLPLAGTRPAVYPATVKSDWLELLRFRHFLRHAYVVELDAAKLRTVVGKLARAVEETGPSIDALVAALEAGRP